MNETQCKSTFTLTGVAECEREAGHEGHHWQDDIKWSDQLAAENAAAFPPHADVWALCSEMAQILGQCTNDEAVLGVMSDAVREANAPVYLAALEAVKASSARWIPAYDAAKAAVDALLAENARLHEALRVAYATTSEVSDD